MIGGCVPANAPVEALPTPPEFVSKAGAVRLGPAPIALGYAPPDGRPANRFNVFVTNASLDSINAVKSAAIEIGLDVVELDAIEGAIEIRHSGPAKGYVTCGSLLISDDEAIADGEAMSALTPILEFRLRDTPTHVLRREMRLDTRSVIRQTEDGPGVRRVSLDTTYAVTRRLERFDPEAGKSVDSETVVFEVEGRGSFQSGMICQPTGVLERTLLSKL